LTVFEPKFARAPRLKAMCELVEVSPRAQHNGLWAAICIALMVGLVTLSVFGGYEVTQVSRPTDEELTTNFFAHQAVFDELVRMLSMDHPGTAAIDVTTMASLDTRAERLATYKRLLQQISVADLRYFPASGKLILVPNGQENPQRPSESYVYLPHGQPRSFAQRHTYYWRGPGVDMITGDRRLEGFWFIRHEMTIEVAVTPY
jgi:hypothetical protein